MTRERAINSSVMLLGGLCISMLSFCGARLGDAMPQHVSGEDVLSVAFGDAKETISRAMVHKADSYFHGGVDMECTEGHEHEEGAECSECSNVRNDRMKEKGECSHEGCHHHHEAEHHHDHSDECCNHPDEHSNNQSFEQSSISSWDPWHWINTRIRAPEVDRHLDGEKAVELMPWFWAAVRADPHNIDAWTTAIYMANNVMKDKALARRVMSEAKEHNPEDLELMWTEGRVLYDRGRGDLVASKKVFEALKSKALRRCGGNVSSLSERDGWMYRFALEYLTHLESK